jgi:hypothetical protein
MSTRVSLRLLVLDPDGAYLLSSSTKMTSLSTPRRPCSAISQTLFMTLVTTRSWGTPERCEISTTRISRSSNGPSTCGESPYSTLPWTRSPAHLLGSTPKRLRHLGDGRLVVAVPVLDFLVLFEVFEGLVYLRVEAAHGPHGHRPQVLDEALELVVVVRGVEDAAGVGEDVLEVPDDGVDAAVLAAGFAQGVEVFGAEIRRVDHAVAAVPAEGERGEDAEVLERLYLEA